MYSNIKKKNLIHKAQESVLAYRQWEISESMLIQKTEMFDNYLSNGDQFSSITFSSFNTTEPVIKKTKNENRKLFIA